MEFLGIPSQGENLEFPLDHTDWQDLSTLEEVRRLRPGEYICVHPGASVPERCWPPERFAAVADTLAAGGLQVVLTGTVRETVLTRTVAQAMKQRPIDLAGRTSLGALGALLSQTRLLVCNDTGVSHLAAALRVPSVVIFSRSDPDRWAPLDRERHRVLYQLPQAYPGSLCREVIQTDALSRGNGEITLTPERQKLSLGGITPEMVLAEAEILLKQEIGTSA
jgi:ADP-heptose:LPS heptosyltransferase